VEGKCPLTTRPAVYQWHFFPNPLERDLNGILIVPFFYMTVYNNSQLITFLDVSVELHWMTSDDLYSALSLRNLATRTGAMLLECSTAIELNLTKIIVVRLINKKLTTKIPKPAAVFWVLCYSLKPIPSKYGCAPSSLPMPTCAPAPQVLAQLLIGQFLLGQC